MQRSTHEISLQLCVCVLHISGGVAPSGRQYFHFCFANAGEIETGILTASKINHRVLPEHLMKGSVQWQACIVNHSGVFICNNQGKKNNSTPIGAITFFQYLLDFKFNVTLNCIHQVCIEQPWNLLYWKVGSKNSFPLNLSRARKIDISPNTLLPCLYFQYFSDE